MAESERRAARRSAAYLLCVDDGETKNPDEMRLLTHYRAADAEGKHAIMDLAEQRGAIRQAPGG